jgi:NitT/TauT family transport system substrate-binding protein
MALPLLRSPLLQSLTRALTLLLAIGLLLPLSQVNAGEVLKVGYNQWIGNAGIFVAMKKDLFKKHGVDVEFTEFPGPGDGVVPVIAGQLDGVMTTTDNVILIADKTGPGKMVQVFFSDTSAGGDAILAKPEIKTVSDLKGKTVAATVGQVNHLLLIKALQSAGLSEADVNLVNMDAEVAGAAFMAGKLDAAVTWEPWLSTGRSKGGNIVFSSAEAPNLILDTFAVNTKAVEKKSAEIAAFLAAVDEGVHLVLEQPDESAKLLAEVLSVSPDEVKEMLGGVKLYDLKDNAALYADTELVGVAQEVADFLHERKIIDKSMDVAPLFDGDLVKAALAP